jgi:hypothetical protein
MVPLLLGYSSKLLASHREADINGKRKSPYSLDQINEAYVPKKISVNSKGPERKDKENSAHSINSIEAFGTLTKDVPEKITGHALLDGRKPSVSLIKNMFFRVDWEKRSDQTCPEPTFYSYSVLKRQHPTLLLSYIENVVELE